MATTIKAETWRAMSAFLLLTATVLSFGLRHSQAAPPDSPWGSDYFPNVPLVNQDGKVLRFYDDMIRDKVVLINFIYASCVDSCPLETAKVRQVQEVLGDRVGRDIFIYSITIDPRRDTPEVLKEYAAMFQVGPGWQFLTGKEADITLIRKKVGLYSDGELRNDHTASLLVGNEATGQWLKRSSLDNPKVLAAVLGERLFNYRQVDARRRNYSDAPPILKVDAGEDLFRRRCQVCHTVGAGDTVGPDLLGVTSKRERAWLSRWIAEPDRMLAERDPVATALYVRFKKLPMPNMRLSQQDVAALVDYLAAESTRVLAARAAGAQEPDEPARMEHRHDHQHQHQHQSADPHLHTAGFAAPEVR